MVEARSRRYFGIGEEGLEIPVGRRALRCRCAADQA